MSIVTITVGGNDISDRVVFAETNFTSVAAAQPGSCQITVKGTSTFQAGRDQICLYVNGQRKWWGYLFVMEQGYIFPDDPEPRVILQGVDLNILFDKLYMYNHAHQTWYPDGGGVYKKVKVSSDDGKVTGYQVSVPVKYDTKTGKQTETSDEDYIKTMMSDFDLDLVEPQIKYGTPPHLGTHVPTRMSAPHDNKIIGFAMINTGDAKATWTPPSSGTSLRAFFTDVSSNVVRTQPGSAIWYIDPDGYIVWRDVDSEWMDWAVGDGGPDAVPVRDLRITTDVSNLKNDVIVFTGTLDPTPTSNQEHLKFVHKINNPSVNLFGRFQWSEVMGIDWLEGMINARAKKVLTQQGVPSMTAEFTIFSNTLEEMGLSSDTLYPGRIARIFSDTHTFMVYDPDTGLQELDGVNLPIRAVSMRFPTQNIVEFRATCGFDTNDPWGLLLALKAPPTRGLVQPNFNVIDRTLNNKTYIEPSSMVLCKEYAVALSGHRWQLTYAYMPNSLTVVAGGARLNGIPVPPGEPYSGAIGYIEDDPGGGVFYADTKARPIYVEYHVWHKLTD